MAEGCGEAELIQAVQQTFAADTDGCAAIPLGVLETPRGKAPPYYILLLQAPAMGDKVLAREEASQSIILSLKACAVASGSEDDLTIASRWAGKANALLTEVREGVTPEDRINEFLVPLGWQTDTPIARRGEGPGLEYPPGAKTTDVKRLYLGRWWEFIVSPV